MVKNTLKGLSVVLGLIFIVGCASKGVEVRRYVEVKERVDQKMEGNAGFLAGDPQPEDRSGFKSTRKLYVLEVSQGDPVREATMRGNNEGMVGDDVLMEESAYEENNFVEALKNGEVIPFIGDNTEDLESSPSFTEYTVKKDDTLQKIAKKFYDSFAKWPRIYEANKDVIDNPDRVKSGTVLQIPMD